MRTQRLIARWTGLAYLGIVLTGLFAEFFVRGPLLVADDALQTAHNIASAPRLFSLSIAADLCMVALDIVVGLGLYRLLRHHAPRLAGAATGLRLLQSAILFGNLFNLVNALDFALRSAEASDQHLAQQSLAQQALQATQSHALGYDLGLVAFGLSCLLLGLLLLRARAAPAVLALGLVTTGAVYLVGSATALFAPQHSPAVAPLYFVAILVEPAFAVWLLFQSLSSSTQSLKPHAEGL